MPWLCALCSCAGPCAVLPHGLRLEAWRPGRAWSGRGSVTASPQLPRAACPRGERHAALSHTSRSHLATLGGNWSHSLGWLCVTERSAVRCLSHCLVHGHNVLLCSKAGVQQLLLFPLLPERTQRKATLCSGLFNFVCHFTAKGRCCRSPRQGGSSAKQWEGAAVQLSPAQLAPVPTMAVLSSSRSTAAGSACSGGFAWTMLLSKGPTASRAD